MEWNPVYVFWSGLSIAIAFLLFTAKAKAKAKAIFGSSKHPPGPKGWPVIGNILDLGEQPHKSLAALSKKYGPLVWLRIGAVKIMVVASAESAMELFKNHDLSFVGRSNTQAIEAHGYNEGSCVFGQHGPYWRMIRRICTTELFTNNRLNNTEHLRRKCVDNMLNWMWDENQEKGSVEIAKFVSLSMFNTIGNLMFTRDLVGPKSEEGSEFFSSLSGAMEWAAKPNLNDFFPLLRWLDPQKIKKHMDRDLGFCLDFASKFVKERVEDRRNNRLTKKKDFLDVMLDFEGNQKDGEPPRIIEKNITIMILELFATATDTNTSTIEWAMTELLRSPSKMSKAQAELDQVVGRNRKIEEGDVAKLPYLQAVVKEALRLYPPAPFLVPRRATEDTKIMGYSIPKNTKVFVNVWAIGRDPVSWEDSLTFKPERFLDSSVEYKGHHFEYIPFGAGRRICIGMPLAFRTLHLILGSLLQTYDWVLPADTTPENIDMTERFGITLCKADPLKAVPKRRSVTEIA